MVRSEVQAPVVVARKSDPRLARLQRAPEDLAAARAQHRGVREEEEERGRQRRAVSEEPEGSEDEDALERRRAAIRARQAQREAEEAAAKAAPGAEEEESSSEYETDSEEEDSEEQAGRLARPVFVPRGQRDTAREKAALEEAERRAAELEEARLEERRKQTKELVAEAIHLEEEQANARDDETMLLESVDTDDDDDDEAEFEAWRGRELGRIRRWHAEREEERRKAEEAERLRNMTEEERLEALRERQREEGAEGEKKRASMKFMQKYYHKGAFFMTDADDQTGTTGTFDILHERDFSEAVGGDRGVDKASLPSVLQIRANDFGKRSRTKWTHLSAEDTSGALRKPRHGGAGGGDTVGAPDLRNASLGIPMAARKRGPAGTDEVFQKPKKYRT